MSDGSPLDENSARHDVEIPVAGGIVRGTHWVPRTPPRGCVVIHPATAVPERLYAPFAAHLAGNGFAAVTYDWTGTGRSGSPRAHRHVTMQQWIDEDAPAVTSWAHDQHPQIPHLAVGHSVGGHALALGAGGDSLVAAAYIASHAGVTRTIPGRVYRAQVFMILSVVGPLLSRALGYMPARAVGLGEDIPAAAMLQWGRWSRYPDYFFDDPDMHARKRAATVTAPVLAIGFSDDPVATAPQIDVITDALTAAAVERRTYTPHQVGSDGVGHMGFFRRSSERVLWRDVLTWLESHLESPGHLA